MPVRVWVSFESARWKSIRNHLNASVNDAACPCEFGCRTSLWPVGSAYEITQVPRSHAAPEQFTAPYG